MADRQSRLERDKEWGAHLGKVTPHSYDACFDLIAKVRVRIADDEAADEYFAWMKYKHDDADQVRYLDVSLSAIADMDAIRSRSYKARRRADWD